MNLKINSRHVEVTPAMRSHLEAGLAKIRKHFDHVLDASAFLIVDNAKEKNLRQAAEITIAAGKQVLNFCANGLVVFSGITANMRYPNLNIFTKKTIVQRKFHSSFIVINVTINRTKWFEFFNFIGHCQITNITGMPDFICQTDIF